jgi:hypothetical protein
MRDADLRKASEPKRGKGRHREAGNEHQDPLNTHLRTEGRPDGEDRQSRQFHNQAKSPKSNGKKRKVVAGEGFGDFGTVAKRCESLRIVANRCESLRFVAFLSPGGRPTSGGQARLRSAGRCVPPSGRQAHLRRAGFNRRRRGRRQLIFPSTPCRKAQRVWSRGRRGREAFSRRFTEGNGAGEP